MMPAQPLLMQGYQNIASYHILRPEVAKVLRGFSTEILLVFTSAESPFVQQLNASRITFFHRITRPNTAHLAMGFKIQLLLVFTSAGTFSSSGEHLDWCLSVIYVISG